MKQQEKLIFVEQDDDGEDFETVIPSKFEVCFNCEGRGSHVHRGVDEGGITPEEFAEDPDFEEDYFSGVYDVSCDECHGQRVLLVPDWEAKWPMGLKERYEEHCHTQAEYAAERAAERRMGA